MQEELQSGIYCIENMINNKKYIGQSIDIETRLKKHKHNLNSNRHQNSYLQSSWNKYGENNFTFYILEYCSDEQLDEKEIKYIDLYDTVNRKNGYNLKSGGQNGGSRYSEESRKKMSESQKEYFKDEKHLQRLSENSLKMWANEEYRKNRCGENHQMYGKHHTEETRKKLSMANKGKPKPLRSKEHCEAISKANKGRKSPNRDCTPVRCIETDQIFADAITAGKELKLKHPNHVIDVCKGRRKTCGEYHFEFINNGK